MTRHHRRIDFGGETFCIRRDGYGTRLIHSTNSVRLNGDPSAAITHWLEQCTGTVKVWRDGGLREVAPLQRETQGTTTLPPSVTLTLRSPGRFVA